MEKTSGETDLLVPAIDQWLEWKLIVSWRDVSDTGVKGEKTQNRPWHQEEVVTTAATMTIAHTPETTVLSLG